MNEGARQDTAVDGAGGGTEAAAGTEPGADTGAGAGADTGSRIEPGAGPGGGERRTPSGPVLIVGFVGLTLEAIGAFQEEDSVVYIEEPDVARKREVAAKIPDIPFARGLIEWEYHLPGTADAFFNAHPGLDPVAVVPAIEYATPFAARLAERYGLPGAGFGAAQILRDKSLLRQVSASAGIANPASVRVHGPGDVLSFMAGRHGPIVLKPGNRQASIGTQVIHDASQVERAWSACVAQDEGIFVPDRPMDLVMLAERYVEGDEFSVEMLVREGEPLFTNVTGKRLFPGPHPVEQGHIVPADIPADLTALLGERTARVVAATGFGTGVVHCEWIVSGGEPYLVECAGRMPGDAIPDIIELAYPVDLFRNYYALMKGEEPPGPLPARAASGAAVRFMAPLQAGTVVGLNGVEDAQKAEGVVHADCGGAALGRAFTGLRNSWDRAGIVITLADDSTEAYRLAEEAAGLVHIDLLPARNADPGSSAP